MKLKKIASLMLAGIMAVSMLAGCKDAASSTPTDPETPVTPVGGVAATINANLDGNKEAISFADDEIMSKLLERYFEQTDVPESVWGVSNLAVVTANTAINGNQIGGTFAPLMTDIASYLNANAVSGLKNVFVDGAEKNTGFDGTYAEMYILNSDIYSQEDALKKIAEYVDGLSLKADGDTDSNGVKDTDYTYTGKAAAIKADSKGGTKSVWVVVISVDRDSSAK